jgi:glycosyltransferase involved in cell wall biosynthesis
VDIPVAYTEFGKKEIEKYTLREVLVLPHGLEHETYKPLNINRQKLFPQLTSSDKLIVNVNSNSQRKSPEKSIEILKELLEFENDYFLYMHMSPYKEIDIKKLASNLGVEKNMIFADPFFQDSKIGKITCSKELLCEIYNNADLVLSTSVGEGWGLTAFEAAACKTPIAVPYHTSYKELFTSDSCLFLPANNTATDNTVFFMKKIWPLVDVKTSAFLIHEAFKKNKLKEKAEKAKIIADSYCWDKVALEWNKIITM